jgi:hypothetical protein
MGEPFDAIGFRIKDEASYHALAEQAHQRGTITKTERDAATLHGCCWQVGGGVEVWTVLHESKEGLFYTDCRPAFRAHHYFALFPWEMAEYEEDGEAVVTARTGEAEVIFELQNLTEIDPSTYRNHALTAAIAGLGYRAKLTDKPVEPSFMPLARAQPRRRSAENDYLVRGKVLDWRELKNAQTEERLLWFYVDADKIKLEVVVNQADFKGQLPAPGQETWLTAEAWLQGYILSDKEIATHYEGVDYTVSPGDFWAALRREN